MQTHTFIDELVESRKSLEIPVTFLADGMDAISTSILFLGNNVGLRPVSTA